MTTGPRSVPDAWVPPVMGDAYFRSVVNASNDAIRILDVSGRVEFVNRRGLDLLEVDSLEQVRGRPWSCLWPEETRPEVERAVAAAARGEVFRFRGVGSTGRGARKWWDTVVSPVINEADGEVVRLIATTRDITAEAETKASLDAIIKHVPVALYVKNADDGRFIVVNEAAELVLGQGREKVLGRTVHDVFPKEPADFSKAQDDQAIQSGHVHITEEEPVDVSGELRYYRTRKVATPGLDGPRKIVVIAEDITDDKRIASELKAALIAAEAASRAKSEFLANMSHELRTPLNGVVGAAELLAAADLSPQYREMLDLIRSSGHALERVLSDVLDAAGLESGRVEIRSDVFDLGELVQGLASLFELRTRDKGLTLRTEVEPALGRRVIGDPTRLKQILAHLLGNAVKFTERGEISFAAERACDGDYRFIVADTGIGLDPATTSDLFERFRQADGSITRRFGGSGLGLAISNELAAKMGGRIEVDSVPSQGSTFALTLRLPDAGLEAQDEDAALALSPPSEIQEEPVRVLLVDDHPANRKVVELILAEVGAHVVAAENGAEGVERFRAERFDVVLMDMQMPVMDGLTATRLIRDMEAELGMRRTPILMLTANALPEHVEASLAAGADRHLAKPIQPVALFGAIEELLAPA